MVCEKCGYDDKKIKLLKLQLTELNKDWIGAESEFKAADELMNELKNMDMDSKKNKEIYEKIQKEHLSKKLDFLRLSVNKIRKISPETADILTEHINQFEKSNRDLKNLSETIDDIEDPEILGLSFVVLMGLTIGAAQSVDVMVKACSYAIRDTLERFEK